MKRCSRCKTEMPATSFYADTSLICTACRSVENRAKYKHEKVRVGLLEDVAKAARRLRDGEDDQDANMGARKMALYADIKRLDAHERKRK